MNRSKWAVGIQVCVIIGSSGILGFVLGWFLQIRVSENSGEWNKDMDESIERKAIEDISKENIKDNLKWITSTTRLSGTHNDRYFAESIRDIWQSQGFSTAGIETYDVLLSYPGNKTHRNKVSLLSSDGEILHEFTPSADVNDQSWIPPYVAYSRSGVKRGNLVFVGTGSSYHFELLRQEGITNFTGKIALTCSEHHFTEIAQHGVSGIIFFPKISFGTSKSVRDDTFVLPDDAILSSTMRKHGSAMGDPLTPRYPARGFSMRKNISEFESNLLQIPVHPISYTEAETLLSYFDNQSTPLPPSFLNLLNPKVRNRQWYIGGLQKNLTIQLEVYNKNIRREIHNAFAMVKGIIEPDRLVVIGGHRDVWNHGAIDSGGSTAGFLEITRVLGKQIMEGWKPRRTLILASWSGEEFGLIGSHEWVEEHLQILGHKGVAYLNMDVLVYGTAKFNAQTSPLMYSLLRNVTKHIAHPSGSTLYEHWSNTTWIQNGQNPPMPEFNQWNSDHATFYLLAGVPAVYMYYASQEPHYPVYHSQYDTYEYIAEHVDPDFTYHQMMSKVYTSVLIRLLDLKMLPFNLVSYASTLDMALSQIKDTLQTSIYSRYFISGEGKLIIEKFSQCVTDFTFTALSYQQDINEKLNSMDPYTLRRVNDQLMLLERMFMDHYWQKDKSSIYRHLLLTPGSCIKSAAMGVHFDVLCLNNDNQTFLEQENVEELQRGLAAVCYAMGAATDMLLI